MDNNNFQCIAKLEHALHVWDEQKLPNVYQKIGWDSTGNRFYICLEETFGMSSRLPGIVYDTLRGINRWGFGQSTHGTAIQIDSLKVTSLNELKVLRKNLTISESEISKLIGMLIQLEKTAECFNQGLLVIKNGDLMDHQIYALDLAREELMKGLKIEIDLLAEVILKQYIKVTITSADGRIKTIPYSKCTGLNKCKKDFLTQLKQLNEGQLKLDPFTDPEEEVLVLKWLSGDLSVTINDSSESEKSSASKILKVDEFYKLDVFAKRSSLTILQEQCKAFALGNVELMLHDPEMFKSYLIGESPLLDLQDVDKCYDSIVDYFSKRLIELRSRKNENLRYDDIFKLIQILEGLNCAIPDKANLILQEIIRQSGISVHLSLTDSSGKNDKIDVPFSIFSYFGKAGIDPLKKILLNDLVPFECPSISDFILVLNWLEIPKLTHIDAIRIIIDYSMKFSFKEKVDSLLSEILPTITIYESMWLECTKLAFAYNLPLFKETLKNYIPHIDFKNQETTEFFKSPVSEEKKLFSYLISQNGTIKKIRKFIEEDEGFGKFTEEISRGNSGIETSNKSIRKFKADSIPPTFTQAEAIKEIKNYLKKNKRELHHLGEATTNPWIREYKFNSLVFEYDRVNLMIMNIKIPNAIYYDVTKKEALVRVGHLGMGSFKTVDKFLNMSKLNFIAVGKQAIKSKVHLIYATREVEIMNALKGKSHVLNLHTVAVYNTKTKKVISTITDFCNMGELADYVSLKSGVESFTDKEKYQIGLGILRGLIEVHAIDVIHRDLKLQNIFLKKIINDKGEEEIYPLVADFGLSCKSNDPEIKRNVGTGVYQAPEILIEEASFTKESDLWSLGVLFSLLFRNEWPFQSPKNIDHLKQILPNLESTPRPKDKDSIDFVIWSLLRRNPKERLDLKSALVFMEKKLKECES